MKKNAGVYKLCNYCTDEIYIDSTKDFKNEESKVFQKLKKRKFKNKNLQESFNIYGQSMFGVECLELCGKNLNERKQYYINLLNPEYNRKDYAIMIPSDKSEIVKHDEQSVRAKRIMNLLQIRIKVFKIILSITLNRR